MHQYVAQILWQDGENAFATGKYSRAHQWTFDGGVTVEASSSPLVVKLPYSKEDAVDPEEAFVASVSSCHMLTFLFLAYREKLVIKSYRDKAVGFMDKNAENRDWISRIELHPDIEWVGPPPAREKLEALHHNAHHECYIANSVKTAIEVSF